MATKYYYLKGKCKWVKARKPDEQYANYTMNLYLDEPSKAVFAESGIQVNPKEDDDGKYYTFRRPHEKLMKGEAVIFGPPKVFAADNTEFDGLVGNGSEVTVKVSAYDTKKGIGHRWESIRVEKLVEYIPADAGAGGFDAQSMPPPVASARPVKGDAPKARAAAPF